MIKKIFEKIYDASILDSDDDDVFERIENEFKQEAAKHMDVVTHVNWGMAMDPELKTHKAQGLKFVAEGYNKKKYNYVIARFWDEDEHPTQKDRLCVYASGSEVQYGTKQDAYANAKIVSAMKGKEYKPYFIDINEEAE